MTRVIAAALLLAALSAPVRAQSPAADAPPLADARWGAFIGCWRGVNDAESSGNRVCVTPAAHGVSVETFVGGQRVSADSRVADGTSRAVDRDGCRGHETIRWSEQRLRLYRSATIACNGEAPRTLAAASFFVAGATWVEVETVDAAGSLSVRVSRLVRAHNQQRPDGATLVPPAGVRLPVEAVAPFTVNDVIELSHALPADGVQAALSEAPAPYRLNAKALVAMADAGVGDRVIDLMVGVTYPSRFVVQRAGGAGWATGGPGFGAMLDPFFAPLAGPAALFNCYGAYSWAATSYWGNCAGYDSLAYAMYSGFYGGYWGPFGPLWVATQPGPGGPAAEPQFEGRVVNGRGYTQVRPVDTSAGSGASHSAGSGGMDVGGGTATSGGVSASGYSGGGSGGGDRMAVPRGPGGLD